MSFEETAGNYSLTDVYAKAQVQSVHDAVRDQILEFLGDDSGILLEDVQKFFLQSGEECKRGSPMYLKLLEKILGGLLRHFLVHGLVLGDFSDLFGSCANRMAEVVRAQRKADITSNADSKDPISIIQIAGKQQDIHQAVAQLQQDVTALTPDVSNADLVQPFQQLQELVRQYKENVDEDIAAIRTKLQLAVDNAVVHPPGQNTAPTSVTGVRSEPAPGTEKSTSAPPVAQAATAINGGVQNKSNEEDVIMLPPSNTVAAGVRLGESTSKKDPQMAATTLHESVESTPALKRAPQPPPLHTEPLNQQKQGGNPTPPPPPGGAYQPPPPPQGGPNRQENGRYDCAPPQQLQQQPYATNALLPGGAKCPKLDSIEPARFEEFRFNFVVYADMMQWDLNLKKVNAILSLSGKASEHLRGLVPHWRLPHVTLDDLFTAWTNRILPQAQVEVARKQVTTMTQKMDESFDDYILRGLGLHRYAYGRVPGHVAAENDLDFIIRLTAGLLDRNIRAHVERARPTSLTNFRELVHKEAAIATDPTSRSGFVGINSMGDDGVQALDVYRSHNKPMPPCELCKDKLHATSGCKLLPKYKELYEKDLKEQRKKRQGARGGRGRGRGGGRGRFTPRRPIKDGEQDSNRDQKQFGNESPKN